jgi:8-oxo-dGTP pyrophosphatase MutT (NUDIX family)
MSRLLSRLPMGVRIDEEPLAVYRAEDGSGFRYTTLLARCKPEAVNRFSPILNDEHDDWGWFDLEEALDLDLHPGVRWLLSRFPS